MSVAAVPDYWRGHALFPEAVALAREAVRLAEDELGAVLRREYPKDSAVRVVHSRGSYLGTVTGWDTLGCRVRVRNSLSGKSQAWWAAYVELVR